MRFGHANALAISDCTLTVHFSIKPVAYACHHRVFFVLYVDCIDSPSVTKGTKGQNNEPRSGQKICSECAQTVSLFVFTQFCSSKQMFILVRRQ